VTESGEFKGKHYDYVKRDILIDHVAVGDWLGRCSYPACGIGVDALKGADPYPNEHACRLRDPDTLDIVGSGEHEHNGKTYRVIYGKPKGEKDAGSLEQAYRYPVKTWTEAEARNHCQDHEGTFEVATKQEGDKMAQNENTASPLHDKFLDEIAKRREGYEAADALIARVKALIAQLNIM
jgi:hypothetical protein